MAAAKKSGSRVQNKHLQASIEAVTVGTACDEKG
jgi:hypothetical protein